MAFTKPGTFWGLFCKRSAVAFSLAASAPTLTLCQLGRAEHGVGDDTQDIVVGT